MDHGHGHGSMEPGEFCTGDGAVMLMGYQAAFRKDVSCIAFLFEGTGATTAARYAFVVIGAFALAFVNEMIRYGRSMLVKGSFPGLASGNDVGSDLARTFAFAVQMLMAYFLMLLIMLYEYVILAAIILGLSFGFFLTSKWAAKHEAALKAAGKSTSSDADGVGNSSTPCCNNDTRF